MDSYYRYRNIFNSRSRALNARDRDGARKLKSGFDSLLQHTLGVIYNRNNHAGLDEPGFPGNCPLPPVNFPELQELIDLSPECSSPHLNSSVILNCARMTGTVSRRSVLNALTGLYSPYLGLLLMEKNGSDDQDIPILRIQEAGIIHPLPVSRVPQPVPGFTHKKDSHGMHFFVNSQILEESNELSLALYFLGAFRWIRLCPEESSGPLFVFASAFPGLSVRGNLVFFPLPDNPGLARGSLLLQFTLDDPTHCVIL